MAEGEHAEKGTKENPLTREDVKRLIRRRGGTAEGLDLSSREFEDGIDLSDLNLKGIILRSAIFRPRYEQGKTLGARFNGSDLQGADLRGAFLSHAQFGRLDGRRTNLKCADLRDAAIPQASFEGADLSHAQLQAEGSLLPEGTFIGGADFGEATLYRADFSGCDCFQTRFERAHLRSAKIFEAHLEESNWGSFVIGEEDTKHYYDAEVIYRRLKQWHTNAGMYDVAGQFFFREMTVRRKMMKWWPNPFPRVWSKLLSLICGYGERPLRAGGWAASVVVGLALVYFLFGGVWQWPALWRSLYFSAVSFTALGYGSWVKATSEWMVGLGAFESFIGVFSIALFLVTFTRKMTR